ncbi:DUF6318 family protein [Paenarthrobacter sp.]|uniref:DUF6318 family protein n=1 Tax=Paenarthrobacter sp. TaxID=1931993 RepID=UPI0028110F3F|nr:DUF6318 family protein [Paenarthrobacter sp.]
MPRHSFMSSSFVRRRPAVLALALAMLLSGCGGATPSSSPTETSTTTATPTSSFSVPEASATPSAPAVYKPADAQGKAQNVPVPVMPELAKENSKPGLEAFIGFYYAVKNYANETGDITNLSELNSPECTACGKLLDGTSDSYINGRWMAGGRITVPTMELDWQADDLSHLAKVQLIQDAITYYNSDGTEGRPPSAATNSAFVFVARFHTSWKVVEIGVIR